MNFAKEIRNTGDFRFYLQQELLERCRRNPKYSLRAFAKALQIGPAALSDMLNGKRTITVASIERLGLALGLPLRQIEVFKRQTKHPKTAQTTADLQFQKLTLDSFALISDWYHYAILELIKVKDFEPSTPWISKSLGITKAEANAAIERLLRLNLIQEQNGRWVDNSQGFTTNIEPGLTSSASRYLQKQILEQSLKALEEIAVDLRNHTSMTMAIDPEDMPEAIERIKRFRHELCDFLERNQKPKEVYQLSISLFPITQIQKKQEKTP